MLGYVGIIHSYVYPPANLGSVLKLVWATLGLHMELLLIHLIFCAI
jgi:hypothetical protein